MGGTGATSKVAQRGGGGLGGVLSKAHAFNAILALKENPGTSAAKLARLIGASDAAISIKVAAHLEEAGLAVIMRIPGPFGQDQLSIELTEVGSKLAPLLQQARDIYARRDVKKTMAERIVKETHDREKRGVR
jgi:hypothetical protein